MKGNNVCRMMGLSFKDEGKDRMPKPGRVLVIDDEVDMLENCARLLIRFGYEVGDISPNLQAKLLRVLQERQVR